jgi:hypothetical protein
MNIAPAKPWPNGAKPDAHAGTTVNAFAGGHAAHPQLTF